MPAPREGARLYELLWDSPTVLKRSPDRRRFSRPDKPDKFLVSWYDERRTLRPSLENLTRAWLESFQPKRPTAALFSVALSRTQNDKGQTPWTLLGGAGDPETEFWATFPEPGSFVPWLCEFLTQGELAPSGCKDLSDLERLGVRVWSEDPKRPPEAKRLSLKEGERPEILLTFLPEESWPGSLHSRYTAGNLVVIPDPRTLAPGREKIYGALAGSHQLPLAAVFAKLSVATGLRVPKVGALEVSADETWGRRFLPGRTQRYASRLWGDLPISTFRQIFDPGPEALELYGKPVARNVQIWGTAGPAFGRWILHGPSSGKAEIDSARQRLLSAGPGEEFSYREVFPPLDLQGRAVEWKRPLAAWYLPATGTFRADWSRMGRALDLAVELDERWGVEKELAALKNGEDAEIVLGVLEYAELLGARLPGPTASAVAGREIGALEKKIAAESPKVSAALAGVVEVSAAPRPLSALTWDRTVGEPFEKRYWERLAELSQGPYVDKNNTDCVPPKLTERCRANHLPALAEGYFKPFYKALGLDAHFHAFHWVTDFAWDTKAEPGKPWWGGVELNAPGRSLADIEKDGHKNVIVVVPGQNHDEAVVLADHYDTAYMEDWFENRGVRHAAAGADDNHSATAALMEAARVLSGLNLKRDVWLVHLTGEEFPSDCLGARALTEALVTGKPVIAGRKNPRLVGLYVMDMIGHHTDRDHAPTAPAVFQIAVGRGPKAAALGRLAHEVTHDWNRHVGAWNRREGRTAAWERISLGTGGAIPRPRTAVFPAMRGEIRLPSNPRSTLYNTDGIIFSDAGIPAVLLMENYDIDRAGYHDSKDTLENIDLDYAAGLSRIAIETVAQAANQ